VGRWVVSAGVKTLCGSGGTVTTSQALTQRELGGDVGQGARAEDRDGRALTYLNGAWGGRGEASGSVICVALCAVQWWVGRGAGGGGRGGSRWALQEWVGVWRPGGWTLCPPVSVSRSVPASERVYGCLRVCVCTQYVPHGP
jgi:hypothetical protein